MSLFQLDIWVQLILFPLITLGLWTLLFNSQNSIFTKIFVEGGYLIFVIPLIILTFLSIPAMALVFWANSVGLGAQMTYSILAVLIGVTLIIEYFYIKRTVKRIEEREQMSIWAWIRRELNPEYKKQREEERLLNKQESTDYFDEISDMNRKRRELDREEKEKLRRALLGESEQKSE